MLARRVGLCATRAGARGGLCATRVFGLVAEWVGGDASPVPASGVLIHIRAGKTKVVVCLSYSLSNLLIYKKQDKEDMEQSAVIP